MFRRLLLLRNFVAFVALVALVTLVALADLVTLTAVAALLLCASAAATLSLRGFATLRLYFFFYTELLWLYCNFKEMLARAKFLKIFNWWTCNSRLCGGFFAVLRLCRIAYGNLRGCRH